MMPIVLSLWIVKYYKVCKKEQAYPAEALEAQR